MAQPFLLFFSLLLNNFATQNENFFLLSQLLLEAEFVVDHLAIILLAFMSLLMVCTLGKTDFVSGVREEPVDDVTLTIDKTLRI